jgi:flavin reductase (DIM6/NTAB) family NADH-FMN oxidoreductase RutF
MRHFATGVCVATTYTDAGERRAHDAVTVNSLTSVSLTPPLVSLCLRDDSTFLADLRSSGVWGVTILAAGGVGLARSFARGRATRTSSECERSGRPGPATGALIYDEGAAWMECRLRDELPAGDHVLLLGEVVAHGSADTPDPLIFLHGLYHSLDGHPDASITRPASADGGPAAGRALPAPDTRSRIRRLD